MRSTINHKRLVLAVAAVCFACAGTACFAILIRHDDDSVRRGASLARRGEAPSAQAAPAAAKLLRLSVTIHLGDGGLGRRPVHYQIFVDPPAFNSSSGMNKARSIVRSRVVNVTASTNPLSSRDGWCDSLTMAPRQ
jgi:hypothetical protein